ncbi:MAG: CDP-alcohol phosphatidyltransferase family protein [Myxococcota bacterium]|nr:CDP-alcohol phosphatidyltransferase family protein [Myxococcota bacterium]
MTKRIALVVCPSKEHGNAVTDLLLGLTVGERLMLTLEKAGITHVAFVGDGPLPISSKVDIEIIQAEVEPSDAEVFTVVSADLVFDSALIGGAGIPAGLPIANLPIKAWREIVKNPTSWLASAGPGSAEAGRGFAIRILDADHKRLAERALMKSLIKEADGIISRNLNRKISTAISRRLAAYPIRPNWVTAVVFLVGILSGPFALMGTYTGFVLGGFCYWFSAVLDGCDGELSRLKFQGSKLGAWLDTIVDDMVGLSYILGMYTALARGSDHAFWSYLGIGGVAAYLATILPRYYIMARRSGSGDYQKMARETRPKQQGRFSRLALTVRDMVFRTDFLPFYALVTAVAGIVPAFAVPFAVGAVASAIDTLLTVIRYQPPQKTT